MVVAAKSSIGPRHNVGQNARASTGVYSWRLGMCRTVGLMGLLCGLVFGACGNGEQSGSELKRQDLSIIAPERCKGSGSANASTPFC